MAIVRARRRAIERLVATDYARDRFARAAFEIVADGLDLGPIAVRTPSERAWVREALARPIQIVAEHVLGALVDELAETLDGGPDELVARILASASDGLDGEAAFEADDEAFLLVAVS